MTTNFFSPLSFVAVFGSGIRDINIPDPQHCAPGGPLQHHHYQREPQLAQHPRQAGAQVGPHAGGSVFRVGSSVTSVADPFVFRPSGSGSFI
jgi:hypothetical protein